MRLRESLPLRHRTSETGCVSRFQASDLSLPRHSMQSRITDVEQVADLRAGEVAMLGRLLHAAQFRNLGAKLLQTIVQGREVGLL